ncbi:hypothetical protein HYH03_005821 [Edaphochlamys debaryana]|uniref:Protein kinase domain-containing protein n=1 Tax=Edaphochlamys debaryana TaxID=47281 RepID=A0A835Y7K5_9CHLO|nr:hypothetical protein HYH03_005821 [Edaphochlamys debaryana]|eukprot:KAG2496223.1 hypothetical protein HYH03_005821 [Edaphochlamys debaryana]
MFEHITKLKRYDEAMAAKLFAQIVSAVSYLHNLNIVHRDIKPENVMFVTPVEECEAAERPLKIKIIDLGLSAKLDPKKPTTGLVGTPGFLAPEVWRNRPHTPALDVYALGVVLFVMLTGRNPHSGADLRTMAYIKKPIREAPGLQDERFQSLSQPARELCLAMMADSPKDRPTCLEVLRHPFIAAVDSNMDAHREMGDVVRRRMRDLAKLRRLHGLRYAMHAHRPEGTDDKAFLEVLDRRRLRLKNEAALCAHDSGSGAGRERLLQHLLGPDSLGPTSSNVGAASPGGTGSPRGLLSQYSLYRAFADDAADRKGSAPSSCCGTPVRQSADGTVAGAIGGGRRISGSGAISRGASSRGTSNAGAGGLPGLAGAGAWSNYSQSNSQGQLMAPPSQQQQVQQQQQQVQQQQQLIPQVVDKLALISALPEMARSNTQPAMKLAGSSRFMDGGRADSNRELSPVHSGDATLAAAEEEVVQRGWSASPMSYEALQHRDALIESLAPGAGAGAGAGPGSRSHSMLRCGTGSRPAPPQEQPQPPQQLQGPQQQPQQQQQQQRQQQQEPQPPCGPPRGTAEQGVGLELERGPAFEGQG